MWSGRLLGPEEVGVFLEARDGVPGAVQRADQFVAAARLPGSEHANAAVFHATSLSTDWCSSQVPIVPDPPSLWAACQDNGLMVLRFTNGVYPACGR